MPWIVHRTPDMVPVGATEIGTVWAVNEDSEYLYVTGSPRNNLIRYGIFHTDQYSVNPDAITSMTAYPSLFVYPVLLKWQD